MSLIWVSSARNDSCNLVRRALMYWTSGAGAALRAIVSPSHGAKKKAPGPLPHRKTGRASLDGTPIDLVVFYGKDAGG